MPSTTTTRKDGIFLVYNTHAYSECGTYDDDTTYVKCSLCNQIVMDEYDCLTEEEIEVHKLGLCMAGVAMRYTAYWLGEMHRRIYKPCEYCHNEPCDCPF